MVDGERRPDGTAMVIQQWGGKEVGRLALVPALLWFPSAGLQGQEQSSSSACRKTSAWCLGCCRNCMVSGASSIAPSTSLGAARLEIKAMPQLGKEGNVTSGGEKKSFGFKICTWISLQILKCRSGEQKAGGKRHENCRVLSTQIALLNTSFLFWIFPNDFKISLGL